MSLVLRDPPALLSLLAGVAVCDAVRAGGEEGAAVKWPNDVVFAEPDGELRKVSGILVEGRPQEGWAVLGIGINVAVRVDDLPPEIALRAASLHLEPGDVERVLARVLAALHDRLAQPPTALLHDWSALDVLRGQTVSWGGGSGIAEGVDAEGRLLVGVSGADPLALDAGEVHLGARPAQP
jgi:BirA family biotin operon repressor/biotin-[acetyl-CoA-carboxylase] ligase